MSQKTGTTTSGLQAPAPKRRSTPDPGDPIAILASKGINRDNFTDPAALATVMEQWGDFRITGGGKTLNLTVAMASELQAVAKLMREHARTYKKADTSENATKSDLLNAVQEIKESLSQGNGQRSYAQVLGNHQATSSTLTKQINNPEIKEKQIFISTRNIKKDSELFFLPASEITKRCNDLLMEFFTQTQNGGIPMPTPLRGVSRSNVGNLTLTFKTIADTARARIHVDEWIKAIDPEATSPQPLFSIVAHNVPTSTWDGDDLNDREAIRRIENENSETMAIEFTIARIRWLNVVICRLRPQALSRPKPALISPGRAGPSLAKPALQGSA
ncbi:hypothetical protein M422DRAFT_271469 [Sphaerobolus stellatus SS14]|uniref:Uncharacterized protein n=1 Tax=Sphaerobolus stellatus (strain SS14) TaxID=990650 RepID=A0A0C9UE70_SPHS4|nr:hypothetical protein M422DRAFT_271469 [Sphaerobolus stellatus SS14]